MHVILNGEPYTHEGDGSLLSLLAEIDAVGHRVAIMVDDVIVPITERPIISLHEGSHIEIMTYAAGG